jgi:hypothetical protein
MSKRAIKVKEINIQFSQGSWFKPEVAISNIFAESQICPLSVFPPNGKRLPEGIYI